MSRHDPSLIFINNSQGETFCHILAQAQVSLNKLALILAPEVRQEEYQDSKYFQPAH
jgi:hypothetical protein